MWLLCYWQGVCAVEGDGFTKKTVAGCPGIRFLVLMKIPLFAILLLFFGHIQSALAGPKLTGKTQYKFEKGNSMVSFGADGIHNPSKENATGNLMMRLWAVDRPYAGGGISGKVIASYKLEGLNPNCVYGATNRLEKATMPAAKGNYYLCLTLLEFKDGDYVIADYRNFSSTVVLGPVPLFTMSGPWKWKSSTEGGTVDITVGKISHTRSGNTGSLRLGLWATSERYEGGSIRGFLLGTVQKESLKTGWSYTDFTNTAKYTKPPTGSYYVNLVLSEFDSGEYRMVASIPGGSLVKFP